MSSFAGAQSAADLPNFHEVIPKQIYRGAQPSPQGIKILVKMGIRTILDLRDEDPKQIQQEKQFAESLGLKFISSPMSAFTYPNDHQVGAIENSVLMDPSLRPVFVHCHHGEDRTGLVIGLHRVFREKPAFSPQQAWNEMLQLGFHKILANLATYFFQKTNWHPFELDGIEQYF